MYMWNVQNDDLTIQSLIGVFTQLEPMRCDILLMSEMFITILALTNWQSSNLLALVQKDNSNILQLIIWHFNGWYLNRNYLNKLFMGTFAHQWQCLQITRLRLATVINVNIAQIYTIITRNLLNYDLTYCYYFKEI